MKLLVTGGAGFMGSNFIRHILNSYLEYQVINVDKLTYAGNPENLRDLEQNPRYRFVQGDIRDKELMALLFSEVDAVINYAAETHVDRSIAEPGEFLYTDVIGTYTLLECLREHEGVKKYIQISTDEVFGSIADGEFHERSPFEPNSPYSASKAGGDLLCRAYQVTYGVPVIVTHSCNFYGPYQYPEKLIPLFITNLLEGKKVPLYADGSNVREWIFTEDHCRAVDLILHKGVIGEVYNIGTGYRLSNLEITKQLLALLDKSEDMIAYVQDRPGHDFRYAIDTGKIRTELGFTPVNSFAQGLEKTVRWYTEHRDWWKPLKARGDAFVNK
ncbi:MAG TPA: dTDP-glucose 4,6-dehydratase [bacterium]|nr:dTDP-glucose 4,6-dehydratase [bacterium]